MSSISYIQQQLRNLGDYTGDGKILSAVDIQKATEYKNNNTINPIIYNKVLEYYNRYVLYTITKQKNGSDPTIIAQGNSFDKLKNDAAQLKSDNLLAVDCDLTQGCKRDCMIGSGLNIYGVGSGLSKDGNCMYGSNNCFSIGLDTNNNEFGSSSIQDGIQKYNINYIQAYGEGIQCPTGSNTITYGPCKNPCPIDCIVGSGSWGSCSIDSSGSSIIRTQTRNEEVIQFPGYGGSSCRELNTFTSDCPIATNVKTSSPESEPGIYFSKITNTLYSNIGIKEIIINIRAGSGFYTLEEDHINIASDKIGNLSKFKSSNELITIYIPDESSSTEHIGEIFSINKSSFPEINTLILYINKIYETDSYEYILDLNK